MRGARRGGVSPSCGARGPVPTQPCSGWRKSSVRCPLPPAVLSPPSRHASQFWAEGWGAAMVPKLTLQMWKLSPRRRLDWSEFARPGSRVFQGKNSGPPGPFGVYQEGRRTQCFSNASLPAPSQTSSSSYLPQGNEGTTVHPGLPTRGLSIWPFSSPSSTSPKGTISVPSLTLSARPTCLRSRSLLTASSLTSLTPVPHLKTNQS